MREPAHGEPIGWSSLLHAYGRATGTRTAPLRRFLATLVCRDDLWGPYGSVESRVFEQARLPRDRAECAALAGIK